jgi:heme-degrading monooxygenase HmoA
MIARIWHGRTRTKDADEYVGYIERTGIEQQRKTAGNLGSQILRREQGGETHFLVVSFWESMGAVERFAGDKPEIAVYFPEDKRFLLEFEPEVQHYEVPVWERGE